MRREILTSLISIAALFVVPTVALLLVRRAARRFEVEQRRRGLWDDNGPLHPTPTPARYIISPTELPLNLSPSEPDAPTAPDPPSPRRQKRR